MPQQLQSARRHYLWSAALAVRAAREARKARSRGPAAIARVVVAHQATAAFQGQTAVGLMLREQAIDEVAEVILNTLAFTTQVNAIEAMLDKVEVDHEFDRLVSSLVQDAGRAAESVSIAVRPHIYHVRQVNPPCCSRCAVLAGRIYKWSSGFKRHPGCDCIMVPTTLANDQLVQDPVELMKQGLVTGMSKADRKAIDDGADFGQVVNVRLKRAGLSTPGRVLARGGRPTPEAIYASATSQDDAIQRLIAAGYVR